MNIGAFEAKTHLAALLKRVAQGETITITRHGTPIARLVPVASTADATRRQQAVDRLRTLSKRYSLEGDSLEDMREEGRK